MASAVEKRKPAADVPVEFGKHLRACMRCKLLKTFEQARPPSSCKRQPLACTLCVLSPFSAWFPQRPGSSTLALLASAF